MGVTGILCSFRLVLEGKRVKRCLSHQHLSSLKSFCQKFHFIRCRGQHIRTLNNTISNSQVSGKSSALCFISIWKFGWLKNPSAKITNLSELYFRFRFILLVQKKKVISMNYGSTSTYGGEWGFYDEAFIHQFRPELTHTIH